MGHFMTGEQERSRADRQDSDMSSQTDDLRPRGERVTEEQAERARRWTWGPGLPQDLRLRAREGP